MTLSRPATAPATLSPRPVPISDSQARSTFLFVLPWEPHLAGGVAAVVNNLASAMSTHGVFRPAIAVNRYGVPRLVHEKHYISFDFSILAAPTPLGVFKAFFKAPLRLWRTYQALRANRVQVVNFHYPGLAPLGVALLKRLGIYRGRLLLSYHGTDVGPA